MAVRVVIGILTYDSNNHTTCAMLSVLGQQKEQRFYRITLMGVHCQPSCQLGAYCHLLCTNIPEAKQCRWAYKPWESWTCCLLSHSFFFLTTFANCKFLQYARWRTKNPLLTLQFFPSYAKCTTHLFYKPDTWLRVSSRIGKTKSVAA